MRLTQAGDPGQRPSASRRKRSLVAEGAKFQALSTSARFLPSRRPLYQEALLWASPSQPAAPPTLSPLRLRSRSLKASPLAFGRTLNDEAPSGESPSTTRSMRTSSAGTSRGSTPARGSGLASASTSFSGGLGRRTSVMWISIGTSLASARTTRPFTRELSRPRFQPLADRSRLTLRFSRLVPKPLKRPISRLASRNRRAFSAPSLGRYCLASAIQGAVSSCSIRPRTRRPLPPGKVAVPPPSTRSPRASSSLPTGAAMARLTSPPWSSQ
ncbi:hypothetical protein FQZ97_800790 [compost metagenome]